MLSVLGSGGGGSVNVCEDAALRWGDEVLLREGPLVLVVLGEAPEDDRAGEACRADPDEADPDVFEVGLLPLELPLDRAGPDGFDDEELAPLVCFFSGPASARSASPNEHTSIAAARAVAVRQSPNLLREFIGMHS